LPRPFAGYELQQEIGRGGMGVVYKAFDPNLKRHVALKMILRGEHASAEDLSRFRAEAQAVAGLAHPNIVPVYAVGEQDCQAYFCMKYVEGTTLAALVHRGPLPSRRAANYLLHIALAVHHAHEQGILHRDLKPSNILIDHAIDEPLVTDFGLAKRVAGDGVSKQLSLTGTGAIVGTPSYMSPEQASGQKKFTPASDVYSLGAILFEMLTGRPPFQAASVVDVLLLVRSEEPVRPRLLNSCIDPDLELICLKCLEKRPEHRYPSALALADDLRRYLNSEPVQARSSSLAYFVGRLFRETHHAQVMEHWGGLWMWHALKIFLLCVITNVMLWVGVREHFSYLTLWSVALVAWGAIFWHWRRRAGPVSFVERQVAHAWASGVIASIGIFIVEVLLKLDVLTLTPVLAVMSGMVFVFKAGTLTGWFYFAAMMCFAAAIPMALFPTIGPLLLGIVSGISFFVPGLRYYRQKHAAARSTE
jgi:serine/threonine-protein kinase